MTIIEYMNELILEEPPLSEMHAALEAGLNCEAAARKLQVWTDKQRDMPIREWDYVDDATKQLYKLLVYDVILALGDEC